MQKNIESELKKIKKKLKKKKKEAPPLRKILGHYIFNLKKKIKKK